jgi:hypothetical protein
MVRPPLRFGAGAVAPAGNIMGTVNKTVAPTIAALRFNIFVPNPHLST